MLHRIGRTILRALFGSVALVLPLLLEAQAPPAANPHTNREANAAFHAGYAAQQSGNLKLARAQFAKAARLAPQIPAAHRALGAVLMELDMPAKAVPEFQTAAKLAPGDARIGPSWLWP